MIFFQKLKWLTKRIFFMPIFVYTWLPAALFSGICLMNGFFTLSEGSSSVKLPANYSGPSCSEGPALLWII
jgi:hypothetical protein